MSPLAVMCPSMVISSPNAVPSVVLLFVLNEPSVTLTDEPLNLILPPSLCSPI